VEILLGLAVIGVIVGGGICGIVAVLGLQELKQRLDRLERELNSIRLRRNEEQVRAPSSSKSSSTQEVRETVVEPEPAPSPTSPSPGSTARAEAPLQAPVFQTAAPERAPTLSSPTFTEQWSSFEVTIGSKWLNWVGVVLVTIGVMFFLKYAYDNDWIGPRGRIAIGIVIGAGALIIGEKARRRGYPILFHALTGGGLAAFYGCVYFSFQVYQLTGQTLSFFLAMLITALAVSMSVVHDAPMICLLGQVGGFLSPILISSGQNRPVELFSFVTILNLASLGCACYKNWRKVNTLAFLGTWLLYVGWSEKFYDESQLGVALVFSGLFYLMFLVAPVLGAAAQREPLAAENLWLVAVDTVVEFINNSALLYWDYRSWLGLAVIIQALTVAGMCVYWSYRCRGDAKTRVTLLFAALALATLAIPIQFRFYALPIGWALEALLLGFIGAQYRQWVFQLAAMVAILLTAGGLLIRLPLHIQLFTPIFNRPFGSWMTVIVMAFALAKLFQRSRERLEASLKRAPALVFGLAIALLSALLHMEVSDFWVVRRGVWPAALALSYQYSSLVFLWSTIPVIFLWLGRNGILSSSVPAALVAFGVGLLVLLQGVASDTWVTFHVPFLNPQWLSRMLFVYSLWVGASWMRSVPDRPEPWKGWKALLHTVEGAGHVILAFLLYAEIDTWISASQIFSSFMRYGFVSAFWSLQALILIGVGLRTRNQFRRMLGFILFGVTVAKVLAIDMAILQPVYRILSFAATGVLLIIAAYLYQKFAKALLESPRADH
jgi:uncharacterized membrane protein